MSRLLSISMLGRFFRTLKNLVFRRSCMMCGCYVEEYMQGICHRCRVDMPITKYIDLDSNPVTEVFEGLVPIEHGSALLVYVANSAWSVPILRFKYHGSWSIAYNMGRWYGALLRDSGRYDDVDVIVPVPLHPMKVMKRGYNQSEYIAEGIAREMGLSVECRAVVRVKNNPPQAMLNEFDRWDNVKDIFAVRHPEYLEGRHLLLVDDVITTGATLTSCAKSILDVAPSCKVSVAALTVAERIAR